MNKRPHVTDLTKGEFSPSGLEEYLSCPRLFYYTRVRGITSKTTKSALAFGSTIHFGVADFYRNRDKLSAINAISSFWRENQVTDSPKRTMLDAVVIMGNYCEQYKNDKPFKPELIECSQWISMPNGTKIYGILDRIQIEENHAVFTDTKTTASAITDWYFKRYENSFQFLCYNHMSEEITGHPISVCLDAIKTPYEKDKSFVRKTWLFTTRQKQDWLNTYCKITDSIVSGLTKDETAFPCNNCACSNFSGCLYLPVCKYGDQALMDYVIEKQIGEE